jgi:hypothetical protein
MEHPWKRLLASAAVTAIVAVAVPATQAAALNPDLDNGYVAAEASGQVVSGGTCPVTPADNGLVLLPPTGPVAANRFTLVVLAGVWGPGTTVPLDLQPIPTLPLKARALIVTALIQACVRLLPLGSRVVNTGTLAGTYGGAVIKGLVQGWFIQAGVVGIAPVDVQWKLPVTGTLRNVDGLSIIAVVPAGSLGLIVINPPPVGDVVVAAIGSEVLLCDLLERVALAPQCAGT